MTVPGPRVSMEPYLKPEPVEYAPDGIPLLYEDENEGDMGEVSWHTDAMHILHICLASHLAARPELRVFANLNLYYRKKPLHPRTGSRPYVSPDIMVVAPSWPLGPHEEVTSYTIGADGSAPLLTMEILSRRSAQQRDKTAKSKLYARLGVQEYFLVDTTGRFLRERLQVRRLRPNGTWARERDADGGVTSRLLGFRVVIDLDNRLRVLDAATGLKYSRPDEIANELRARQAAEARIHALEEELARLKAKGRKRKGS